MNDGDYVPKLVVFPGAKVTPEIVLNRTSAKLGRIKAVAVVIQWDDDTFDCDWSSMPTSMLCMAYTVLQLQAQQVVMGNHPDANAT